MFGETSFQQLRWGVVAGWGSFTECLDSEVKLPMLRARAKGALVNVSDSFFFLCSGAGGKGP